MPSPLCRFAILASALITGACFNPNDTSSTTGGGTSATSTGSGSGSGGAMACADYCTLIGQHCTADNAQYADDLSCKAVCAVLPPGSASDQTGDSVACRTFHAINAGEDPVTHCPHAGPSGGGICGGACEDFCTIALGICTGKNQVWDTVEACVADCGQFPTDPPYSPSVSSGDSYACRLTHLTFASLQPDVHCPHIGLVSSQCNAG